MYKPLILVLMSIPFATSQAVKEGGCTYDDCLIGSFLKNLFSKIHGAKSSFDYVLSHKISALNANLAELNTDNLPEMSLEYLGAMEKALPDVEFRYVVVHKGSTPVLLAYYQLFTITSANFNLSQNKGLIKGILRFFLGLKKAKLLVSGNAMRNETPSFIYNKKLLTREQAMDGLVAAAEKIAAEECTSAVVLRDVAPSPQLSQKGYQMPWDDKAMAMAIDSNWASLQDYTNNLSRKYKTRANKAIAASQKLTIATLTEKQVAQHQAEMNRMFSEVTEQQPFVLTAPAEGYITTLKKIYKDAFEVVGFFDGSKLVAFYTAFISADAYEMYYVGFDYHFNSKYQLYFNMLFSGLEKAILLKKATLKLGRTSFDAKASLGAKPYGLDYLIKIGHLPDFVLQRFVNYFSAMEDHRWKQRNPLKGAEQENAAGTAA